MKNIFIPLILFSLVSFGQTFNDYNYIKLESNDYSMDIISTATQIFRDKGFNVIQNDNQKVPRDVKDNPCSMLRCKIKYKRGKTGWTNSKLELSLINCQNKVVYFKKTSNTTNFGQPDVLNNFNKATASIMPKTILAQEKKISKGEWAGNGSGLIISKSGHIVTNYHVIEDTEKIEVEFILNGEVQKYNAEIVKVDKVNDLAIIKIFDMNFDGIDFLPYNFKTRSSDVGTKIYAYGYPMALSLMGKEIKITDGIISSKSGFDGDITTYQITAPIQAGNSGGPLFDEKANLIGINSSIIKDAENVSYTIKSNYVLNLIDVLPKSIDLPSNTNLQSLPLTEQIKELSKCVVLIKIK